MPDPRHRRRAFKSSLMNAVRHLNFNLFNLPASGRVTLTGCVVCVGALFVPWLEVSDAGVRIAATAFSPLSGYAGWIMLPVLAGLAFLTISTHRKEAVKSRLSIPFYDYTVVFFGGVVALLLAVTVFFMGMGFARTVGSVHVNVGVSGITFEIVGALLVIAGGALNYHEKKRELLHMIYLENLAQKETDRESYSQLLGNDTVSGADRRNMSLPV